MPNYKLTYFTARGIIEPTRFILAYSGVPYEDIRIPLDGLTPEKKTELGLHWGQLPTLEVDGKQFAQSKAIARYLAKKYNLVGKDELEAFKCDEIVDAIQDFISIFNPLYAESDPKKLDLLKTRVSEVDAPVHLSKLNAVIQKIGTKWTVGNQITWADLYIGHFFSSHFETTWDIKLNIKQYPAIVNIVKNVHAIPAIEEWLKKRPQTKK